MELFLRNIALNSLLMGQIIFMKAYLVLEVCNWHRNQKAFFQSTFTVVRKPTAIQIRDKVVEEMREDWNSRLNMKLIQGSTV